MSLIKIAVIAAAGIGKTLLFNLPLGFSYRAAKAGDPLKYLMTRSEGPIRKFLQPEALAITSNMVKNIRNGMVQDSTSDAGAMIDAISGHFGRLTGKAIEDVYNTNSPDAIMKRNLLNKIINPNGTYNIKNIETALEVGNKGYSILDKYKNVPFTLGGIAGGSAIGYATGDQDHKLKSTLKGGLIGGALGGAVQSGSEHLLKEFDYIPAAHAEYFKDDYWRKQLVRANNKFYQGSGKIIANALTSTPEDRAVRILQSEKLQNFGDSFYKKINPFKRKPIERPIPNYKEMLKPKSLRTENTLFNNAQYEKFQKAENSTFLDDMQNRSNKYQKILKKFNM